MAIRVTEVQEMIQRRNRGRDGRNDSSDEQINRGDDIGRGPLERYLSLYLLTSVWRLILPFDCQLQTRRRYRPRLRY